MTRIKWNEKTVEARFKAGYGEGTGSNYKPWLEVTDLSSTGRSRRMWSNKTGRTHHLFSDVEKAIFIASEWCRDVVDIREQYFLDRDITQTIAQEIGVHHPKYPGTHVPTVMTVDFLLTVRKHGKESFIALNAKRDEEADDETSINKLEIHRTYFENLEVPHYLIYHSQLPKQKIANIDWIRSAQLAEGETEPRAGMYAELKSRMSHELTVLSDETDSLSNYCCNFDARHGLEIGTGLRVSRMLMQERALIVDLQSLDLAKEPLSTFVMTSQSGRLRSIKET